MPCAAFGRSERWVVHQSRWFGKLCIAHRPRRSSNRELLPGIHSPMPRKSLHDLKCRARYHSSFPLTSSADECLFYQRIQPSSCYGIRTWSRRVLAPQHHLYHRGRNVLVLQAQYLNCRQHLRSHFLQRSSGLRAREGP